MYRIFVFCLLLSSFSACKTFYRPVERADISTETLRAVGGEAGNAVHYPSTDEGQKTASGEVYRHSGLTAAHRSLPFGTLVNVLNIENGKRTQVRINDRLTDNESDVILLSGAAAQQLDMIRKGRAQVQIFQGDIQIPQALAANATPPTTSYPSDASPNAVATPRPVVQGMIAKPDEQIRIYNAANAPLTPQTPTIGYSTPTVTYPPLTTTPAPSNPYPTPSLSPYPSTAVTTPTYPTTPPVATTPYPVSPSVPVTGGYTPTPYQPSTPTYPASNPNPVATSAPRMFTVQAIVHSTKAKAQESMGRLGGDAWMQEITLSGRKAYRVLYGQYNSQVAAERARDEVRRKFAEAIVKDVATL